MKSIVLLAWGLLALTVYPAARGDDARRGRSPRQSSPGTSMSSGCATACAFSNASFAAEHFPEEEAVGQRIRVYVTSVSKGAKGPSITVSRTHPALVRKLFALGFADAFRLFEQPERSYTWWDYRMMAFRRKMGLRIDHVLLSPELARSCTSCTIDLAPRRLEAGRAGGEGGVVGQSHAGARLRGARLQLVARDDRRGAV